MIENENPELTKQQPPELTAAIGGRAVEKTQEPEDDLSKMRNHLAMLYEQLEELLGRSSPDSKVAQLYREEIGIFEQAIANRENQ